jgi:thiol-disulfide isomerase/thioredoxin
MVSLSVAVAAIALSGVGQTTLLDFYGDHCGPCRTMQPTIQALVDAGCPVKRINVEQRQNAALVAKYRISRIPCFVMLVNGREVDRVEGAVPASRLQQMCQLGMAPPSPQASPAMLAQATPPPASSALSAPFDGWDNRPTARQPAGATGISPLLPGEGPGVRAADVSTRPSADVPGVTAAGVADATLVAATVRLRVEDADGHSCGSGTIIDARSGEALILTCGHIFRDYKGAGRIEVDLFGPTGPQRVPGQLHWCSVPDLNGGEGNSKPDLGLVRIRAPGVLATARVAPPSYRIQPGMPVVSVGCNNGDSPSVRHSQVTSLDKFQGASNIQVAGQPVEGRSGGGLFSSEGYLIGVCNAADPSDKEGLFAALGSIQAELDQVELAFVYRSPTEPSASNPAAVNPAAVAANPVPAVPKQASAPASLASWNATAEPAAAASAQQLPPHEQAALDEIRRRMKEGADVTIVVHPRNNPNAKSEVYMLDHASGEFVSRISADARRQDRPYPTSLELPKPRKILLEWSADDERAEAANRPAAIMDAPPRVAPKDTVLR